MAQPPKPGEAGATHSRPAGLSPRELVPYTLSSTPFPLHKTTGQQGGVEGSAPPATWGIRGSRHREMGRKSPRCPLLADGGLDRNIGCVESCQLSPLPQMTQGLSLLGTMARADALELRTQAPSLGKWVEW